MKLGRTAWKTKLDLTMKLWSELRPNESQRFLGFSRNDFSFGSIRTLATNIDFSEWVNAWAGGDDSWSFRVRGAVSDGRVMNMESHVVGYEVSGVYVLDFDVLAASCLMDGQSVPDPPRVSIDASDAEVASHLADYCLRTDRIWAFFGGANVDHLPALVIWMIQNRRAVGASNACVSMVCAAYVYGETQLSLDLLAEYEMEWKRHMQLAPGEPIVPELVGILQFGPSRELVQEMGTEALAEAARLRNMIEHRYLA